MSDRNKTYVIFDADNDMWAYAYMKGWKSNENMDFNFYDAHDLNVITDRASEDTVKRKLRERLAAAKQVVVLIGEHTRNLYKFVRWEMEAAINRDLPIVAVNLNKKRVHDPGLCPPILDQAYVIHVSLNARIIQYALDNLPLVHSQQLVGATGHFHYPDSVYRRLGL